jgi:hypothetical protein
MGSSHRPEVSACKVFAPLAQPSTVEAVQKHVFAGSYLANFAASNQGLTSSGAVRFLGSLERRPGGVSKPSRTTSSDLLNNQGWTLLISGVSKHFIWHTWQVDFIIPIQDRDATLISPTTTWGTLFGCIQTCDSRLRGLLSVMREKIAAARAKTTVLGLGSPAR